MAPFIRQTSGLHQRCLKNILDKGRTGGKRYFLMLHHLHIATPTFHGIATPYSKPKCFTRSDLRTQAYIFLVYVSTNYNFICLLTINKGVTQFHVWVTSLRSPHCPRKRLTYVTEQFSRTFDREVQKHCFC